MFTTRKINITFISLIIMAFVLCCVGSLNFSKPTQLYAADTNSELNNLAIKVDLVSAPTPSAENQTDFETTYYSPKGIDAGDNVFYNGVTSIQSVTNGGIVQLNYETNAGYRQALYIHTEKSTDKTIILKSVDLGLNGQTLLHNWKSNIAEDYAFNQYLFGLRSSELSSLFKHQEISTDPAQNVNMQTGFSTTKCDYNTAQGSYNPSNPTDLEEIEGKYTIKIGYSVVDSDSQSVAYEAEFEFIMYRNDTFDPMKQQPTFANTTTKVVDNNNQTVNYFNFTNSQTIESKRIPAYPTLTFNPNKFSIKYTYNRYSQVYEEYETSFDADEKIFSIKNLTTNATSTYSFPQSVSESDYQVTILFDEVGEYHIEKTAYLTYKEYVNDVEHTTRQIITKKDVGTDNDILQNETLIINGYMAQYAVNSTSYAMLYDETYESALKNETSLNMIYSHKIRDGVNYVIATPESTNKIYTADFTFATTYEENNEASMDIGPTNNGSTTTMTKKIVEKTIVENTETTTTRYYTYTIDNSQISALVNVASTNLPPVTFNFYGKINTAKSWYFFKKYNSTEWEAHNYIANMSFKTPGEYYVCLSFEDVIATLNDDEDETFCEQMFHFIITNNQAQVKLKEKTDDNFENCSNLNNVYTNKNVFISWDESGPFDAKISVEYSIDGGSNSIVSGYTTFNGTVINSIPTELTSEGTYTVKVYKTNTPQYAVNYKFTIDKTPPQGITVYGITNDNKIDLNTPLSSDANFNLIVNQPFAWSWNDDNVSAKYFFASITRKNNPAISLIDDLVNGKKIVPTDYEITQFSSPIEYANARENVSLNTLNQIISSPQIAVLMLSDLAGNTSTFITILDTTESNILYNDSINLRNIKSTTSFTWGTHKSISLNTSNSENRNLNENNGVRDIVSALDGWIWGNKTYTFSEQIRTQLDSCIDYIEENLLILPIKSVSLSLSSGSIGNIQTDSTSISPTVTYNSPQNWKMTISVPESISYNSSIFAYLDDNEATIVLTQVTDLSNTSLIGYNISTYSRQPNIIDSQLEAVISLDKSDSYMAVSESEAGLENEGGFSTLLNGGITNQRVIEFCSTDSPDFPIENITLAYYQFTFDKSSVNYPFSQTATKTITLYNPSITPDIPTEYKSGVLLKQNAAGGGIQSAEGLYIITLTSKNAQTSSQRYIYIVDRQNVIPANTRYYGDGTYLSFGSEDVEFNNLYNNFPPAFNNNLFSIDNDNKPISTQVKTDMNVTINIPADLTKYNYRNNDNSINYTYSNMLPIFVVLEKFAINPGDDNSIKILNTPTTINADGVYRVIMFDLANYPSLYPLREILSEYPECTIDDDNPYKNNIVSLFKNGNNQFIPNYSVFTFEINRSECSIDFKFLSSENANSYEPQSYTEVLNMQIAEDNQQTYYTNKHYTFITWTESDSPYISRFDARNIQVQIGNGENSQTIDAEKEFDTRERCGYIDNNGRKTYYAYINTTNSPNITLTIRLTYTNGQSKIKVLVIDSTIPLETIEQLVRNDAMLSTYSELTTSPIPDDEENQNSISNNNWSLIQNLTSNELKSFLNYYVFTSSSTNLKYYLRPENHLNNTELFYYNERNIESQRPRYTDWSIASGVNSCAYTDLDSIEFFEDMVYDIAEYDFAGNVTVYSVLITESEEEKITPTPYIKTSSPDVVTLLNNDSEQNILNEFTFTQDNSWNISIWNTVKIKDDVTGLTKVFFIIPQDYIRNLPILKTAEDYAANLTIIPAADELSPLLNAYLSDIYTADTQNLGNNITLSFPTLKYQTTINKAGKELSLTQNPTFITSTDAGNLYNTLTIDLENIRANYTPSTYVTEIRFTTYDLTSSDSISSNIYLDDEYTYQSIDIAQSSIVVFEITDNFGRIGAFTFDNGNVVTHDPTFSTQTIVRYEEITKEDYAFTNTSFAFRYNQYYKAIISIVDMNTEEKTIYESTIEKNGNVTTNDGSQTTYKFGPNWTKESIINNGIITLNFSAPENAYILISIRLQLIDGKDASIFKYGIYSMHPKANITFANGSTIDSYIITPTTGNTVFVRFPTAANYLFNPGARLIFVPADPEQSSREDGLTMGITTECTEEGDYTVVYYNDIATFGYSENVKTFSIRKNTSSALYYITIEDEQDDQNFIELAPVQSKYICSIDSITKAIPHYIYQHLNKDTDWRTRLHIALDGDKGLTTDELDSSECDGIINTPTVHTRVYKLYGETTQFLETYFAVTCIVSSDTTLKHTDTAFELLDSTLIVEDETIDDEDYVAEPEFFIPETNQSIIYIHTPTESDQKPEKVYAKVRWTPDYVINGISGKSFKNFYKVELYEGEYEEGYSTPIAIFTSGEFTIDQTGVYTIRVIDDLGRVQTFQTKSSQNASSSSSTVTETYQLIVLNDLAFYINNSAPIPYATYSSSVDLYIPQNFGSNRYDSVTIEVTRNNELYDLSDYDEHCYFEEIGTYTVYMSASLRSSVGTRAAELKAVYNFSIISPNTTTKSYSFTPISGHEIVQVFRLSDEGEKVEITDEIKEKYNTSKLYNLYIDSDTENFGNGKYEIVVKYDSPRIGDQNYNFSFWISDSEATITCSRAWGSTSAASFDIYYTPSNLFQAYGECLIVVTLDKQRDVIRIDESNSYLVDSQAANYKAVGVYIIQLQSTDGTIIETHRITIKTPLNVAAIIMIILVAGAVVVGIVAFIKMRKKMKVR